MNKEIEAILIDVDGCVVPTNGEVTFEYYQGLNHFSQYIKEANRGRFPPIGFCSGRDRNYIEAVSFFVGLPNFWSIIESGVALFNPTTKELIFNPDLTAEKKTVFEVLKTKTVPKILEKYSQIFLYPGNMICIAFELKHGARLTIKNAYQAVKKELEDLLQDKLLQIHHSDCAIDISPAGVDKASGIKFLSQHTGVSLKRTVGIGDSNGDFPLFEQVGHVGCPANASDDCKEFVKKRKGYISPYKYALGVANIIGYCLEKEG